MNRIDDTQLDALLQGWREPLVRSDFTRAVVANLPAQEREAEVKPAAKLLSFPQLFGPGAMVGAAAAVLLLLVIGLAHTSRVTVEDDLAELESSSDDALSELYRLIHMEGLVVSEELAPEDADTALLLFATGG